MHPKINNKIINVIFVQKISIYCMYIYQRKAKKFVFNAWNYSKAFCIASNSRSFISFSSIKIKTFYWRPFPVRHGIHIEKRNADRFFNRLVALNRKQLIDFLSLHMKVTLRYSYPFKSRYVNDRKAMSRYDLAANQFLWKNGKFSSLYWKIWDIE